MPTKDIIVIGASAGGIEALRVIAGGLPKDFPASVFVVLHAATHAPGVLADILDRAGALPATNAVDRERIQPGHIYVAPPDRHLVIEPNRVRLTRGPKENRFRPAVDPLFRSAMVRITLYLALPQSAAVELFRFAAALTASRIFDGHGCPTA